MKSFMYLVSILLLAACFDDSSDDDTAEASLEQEGVGFFIDSPVQGLSYSSASHTGTTDALGRFDYETGETITFSLGDLTLPAVTASKAIHISDLFSGGLADTATVNLARLLLTLDTDADSDNGIQLSADVTSSVNTSIIANLNFSSASFDTAVATYLGNVTANAFITASEAQTHINETKAEVEGLLAGCGNECVPRVALMESIENVFPRHAQQAVPIASDISITFAADFEPDLSEMNVEMFAVSLNTYDNCRIDWPGLRCDDLGVGSYDITTHIVTDSTRTVSGKTVDFSIENLHQDSLYIVHIFHDGEEGDDDNYKTWWLFYTE